MRHDLVVEGRVVMPSGLMEAEVGVTDGKISEVKKQGLKGERRITAGRALIFPGFVDVHVHMREPGWEREEDFISGTRAAAHGGVTTVADMPNNPSPTVTPEAARSKRALAGKAVVKVELYGGVVQDHVNRVPDMTGYVVGYKIYLAASTGTTAFPYDKLGAAFQMITKTDKPVGLHCEDQATIDQMSAKLRGVQRPDIYCDLRPPEAEERAVSKVVEAGRGVIGLKANICHATTKGTLSTAKMAQGEGLGLTCEAALHHLYYSRKAMAGNPLLQSNPPLRSEEDRASLVAGLKDGTVSFLVTDHAPHLKEEKIARGLSGVPGLDDYGHILSWLIKAQGLEVNRAAEVASSGPAAYLGLDDRGSITPGKRADLTILEFGSPEVVTEDELQTKCGWSPYVGKEFPGRVRWTIVGGEPIVDDYELVR